MAVPQGPVRLAVDPSPPKDNDGNLPARLRSRIRSRFRKLSQRRLESDRDLLAAELPIIGRLSPGELSGPWSAQRWLSLLQVE